MVGNDDVEAVIPNTEGMKTFCLACDEHEADIRTRLKTVVVERFWRVRNPVEGIQVYCAAAEGITDKGSFEQWAVVTISDEGNWEAQQAQARDTLMASAVIMRACYIM